MVLSTCIILLIVTSVCETSGGLLCGNLPVLPRCYRHVMPKFTSLITRISSSRSSGGINRSSGTKRSEDPSIGWPRNGYFEVDERDLTHPSRCIIAGTPVPTQGKASAEQEMVEMFDVESGIPEHGIRKTVQISQYADLGKSSL